ncbi:MAG: ZIP family metal transporter [Candidatus Thermoplasmatota archaeon]|nr:ZIP family metal transporter [Candidatus Thermoplasmatota archaeon]
MAQISTLLWILGATILDGLMAFAGAVTLKMSEKTLNKIVMILVAFAAGSMLAGALFHLIPEAMEKIDKPLTISALILAGFLIFFIVERYLHWHHCHDPDCKTHPVTTLVIFGDSIHNLIDGVVIAASFMISIPFGIVTTAVILGHELPQELGNFGILVYGGYSKQKALAYNAMAQFTCVIGGVLGYALSYYTQQASAYLLPFAAGGFLYIAASDLIPEMHKEPDLKKVMINFAVFCVGLAFMIAIKVFAGA